MSDGYWDAHVNYKGDQLSKALPRKSFAEHLYPGIIKWHREACEELPVEHAPLYSPGAPRAGWLRCRVWLDNFRDKVVRALSKGTK